MSKSIRFVISGGFLMTKCKHFGRMVGNQDCMTCKFFGGLDEEKFIITCNHGHKTKPKPTMYNVVDDLNRRIEMNALNAELMAIGYTVKCYDIQEAGAHYYIEAAEKAEEIAKQLRALKTKA